MNATKRHLIFERLRDATPAPETELTYASVFELLIAVILSAQATDVSVNLATRKLYPVANTPAAILALGVEGPDPLHPHDRALQQQGAQHHQDVSGAHRPARRGSTARSCRTRSAARGRPQNGQRRSQYRVRRTNDRGRHTRIPRGQPYAGRAGQDDARGRGQAGQSGSRGIQRVRASLVDSARPLRVHGA